MYQEEVMVPIGDWSGARLKNLSEEDLSRRKSATDSRLDTNKSNHDSPKSLLA